jgi:hypothetical protein
VPCLLVCLPACLHTSLVHLFFLEYTLPPPTHTHTHTRPLRAVSFSLSSPQLHALLSSLCHNKPTAVREPIPLLTWRFFRLARSTLARAWHASHSFAEASLEGLKEPVKMWKVEDEMDEQMEMAFPESGQGAE